MYESTFHCDSSACINLTTKGYKMQINGTPKPAVNCLLCMMHWKMYYTLYSIRQTTCIQFLFHLPVFFFFLMLPSLSSQCDSSFHSHQRLSNHLATYLSPLGMSQSEFPHKLEYVCVVKVQWTVYKCVCKDNICKGIMWVRKWCPLSDIPSTWYWVPSDWFSHWIVHSIPVFGGGYSPVKI